MKRRLTERIREFSSSFSKGQMQIAKFIEGYPDKVAFMTASKLGSTVGVSESTVVRFATEIGYSGYPQLQKAIQEMVRNRLTSFQRLEMTSNNIPKEKLLDTVLDQDINIIKRTKEEIDHALYYKTVEALVPVKSVYILAAGSSFAFASFMAHYFELIFDSVHLIEDASEAQIYQQMVHVDKEDAVIAISFPRYSKKVANALHYAKRCGAVTIAITDSDISPMAKHASHLLLAHSDMVSFVDSLVGPLSVINALIVTVAMEKKEKVGETLKRLEDIWEQYPIYEKVDEGGLEDEI